MSPSFWGKVGGGEHRVAPDSGGAAGGEPLSGGIAFVSFQKQQPLKERVTFRTQRVDASSVEKIPGCGGHLSSWLSSCFWGSPGCGAPFRAQESGHRPTQRLWTKSAPFI